MTLTLTPRAERCRVPLQTGAAAGLAWWIATRGLGDATPLCAPVVAVISIGATMSGRWRRTVEVILGLTIGIGLATLLVSALGHGALMLAVLVTAAMLTADAARGGELLVMQAGIAATLVFAGHVESANSALSLVVEALTGAGCALLVSLFARPDPTAPSEARPAGRRARPCPRRHRRRDPRPGRRTSGDRARARTSHHRARRRAPRDPPGRRGDRPLRPYPTLHTPARVSP